MKRLILIALAVGAVLSAVPSAEAAGGCGVGWHRGPYGGCRRNAGPPVVVVPGPRAGTFYEGSGWWDGHRYWRNRAHWHGGWRYY